MPAHLKNIGVFAVAAMILGLVLPESRAQVAGHCRNGTCGSPLAGPCIPASPYGYVPTSWRRWPTDQVAAPMFGAEELPTPAAEGEQLPAPATPQTRPLSPREPIAAPSERPRDQPLAPPFGEEPLTPPFGEEPSSSPFGEEPQAPPSAADPLAAPFGDEPPAPPEDKPNTPPSTDDLFPGTPEEKAFVEQCVSTGL